MLLFLVLICSVASIPIGCRFWDLQGSGLTIETLSVISDFNALIVTVCVISGMFVGYEMFMMVKYMPWTQRLAVYHANRVISRAS